MRVIGFYMYDNSVFEIKKRLNRAEGVSGRSPTSIMRSLSRVIGFDVIDGWWTDAEPFGESA
jgi:hypothetical protein